MEAGKVFGLFDSLISPVATYGSVFWLPHVIKKSAFQSKTRLLDSWESFKCETLNQKCSRMFLSVHKKTSRLAVLGELGRYPIFINSLAQCLNYKLSMESRRNTASLVDHVMTEMEDMTRTGQDCWLTRVRQFETLLDIPRHIKFNKSSGKQLTSVLKSKFDRHWIDKVNEIKTTGSDPTDHNKLRTYKSLKSSFTCEPYITLVRNRNQRSSLTRLRVSAHNLAIESGRKTRPITPIEQRICLYCKPETNNQTPTGQTQTQTSSLDDEFHFLIKCQHFAIKRNCLFGKMSSIIPGFNNLSDELKFVKLLTPTSPRAAKLTNKFIKIIFKKRNKIDTEQ